MIKAVDTVTCSPNRATIAGPAGKLEIWLECPKEPPRALLLIAHPHPLYGGTMENKVVHTLARAALNVGVAALRFNFRGVGQSAGRHDQGDGEQRDLLAVVEWARARLPGIPLWLAGFSFGARIALLSAGEAGAERLLLVAPPLNLYPDLNSINRIETPCSVLMGDRDEVVPFGEVAQWVERQEIPPDFRVFPGASHFFHRRLVELRGSVEQVLEMDIRQGVPDPVVRPATP